MARRVLGFTFINAHRALHCAAAVYAEMLRQKGYEVELIDLGAPDIGPVLERLLRREEVAFCYAPQGVGSRLGSNGQSLWKQRRIPFIALHVDNPCYNIYNHFNDTRYVANLYFFASFTDLHRQYIGTDQIVAAVPFQVYDSPLAPLPWRERTIGFLYLKAGESVADCEAALNGLAPPLRNGVWQQLERTRQSPNLAVCDLVQELFDGLRLARAEHFDLFWGCAHWMDMYIRRKRAADFVEWLKLQESAVIVGDGWDFIDRTHARARFRPSIDVAESVGLFRQSRIICSTTPYGRDIIHERAVMGLLNESLVVSDTNAWWDAHFGHVPAFKRFDWGLDLAGQLQPVLDMPSGRAEAEAPTGRPPALAAFTGQDLAQKIVDCVARIDPECAA